MTGHVKASASKAKIGLLQEEMAGISVRKDAFLKSHDKAARSLERNLDRFLKSPDEDAVHDARTAIRRVEAHVDLLPREIRKSPEVRELLKKHRRVMKRTAKVRDMDVIRGEVSRRPSPATARLVQGINERRRDSAKEAGVAVASARKLSVPAATSKDVTQSRLQRRFEKVVNKLTERINDLLPAVIEDSAKVKELHMLRIDCKRLRYTLELALDDKSPAIVRLEKWQDALGSIHDWDVTTAYLREVRSPVAGGLLRNGVKEREREFQDFARSVLNPV